MNKENSYKKLIRSKSGLRIVSADDNQVSPFLLGEPDWIPDKDVVGCTRCGIKFKFTTRRHHCRRCGQIYCSSCCDHKLELPRMCFVDPVRICEDCVPLTLEENKFFNHRLKTLTNGATFILSSDNKKMAVSLDVVQCKLSADHRYLLFDGVKLPPVYLCSIYDLKLDHDLFKGVQSIEIVYKVGKNTEFQSVKLETTQEIEHRRAGSLWITALQQAIMFLREDPLREV